MKNINAKKIVAVMAALSLASMALMAGCASQRTDTALDYPGIMTQPVEDTVKLAAEKAAEEKAAKELAAQREAAKKAAEEAKAAADDAALDGGEIVEDENAPEGTVAVKTPDGETRYVPADKAESNSGSNGGGSNKGSDSGSSNGGSSSSNGGSSNSGSNSGSSNSGSSNGGGSASKPAPAPEPEPAPAPAPEPEPEPDHKDDAGMHGGNLKGFCYDCGWSGSMTNMSATCPNCGSDEFATGH
ncbi:hydrogenase maturation nickel metallochaperone HypA [Adlercreutzia muris]|uniref:hydrogenase maturation nickel metallochaperone HypA n=1 Tax=Adlercreutzia muris TaxID=1796610 RepID=UPI001F56C53F|nr:hydrogenase maturation nickel metallochaperone HypA [Adlercreutzia muris]